MGSINRVILIGNLGDDPEVKETKNGKHVANFRVATNTRWNDASTGEVKERTEWHRVVAWGKTAELVGEYLAKGRQVCVEGRLQTRKWQDDEGVERYTTEVVADHVTFLGGQSKAA